MSKLPDIAYCTNAGCPFEDCERHITHCKEGATYTFVNFAGICRRYVSYKVDEVVKRPLISKEEALKMLKDEEKPKEKPKEVGFDYLVAWYISSVSDEDKPIWTEEHIEELLKDFIVIPREQESKDL